MPTVVNAKGIRVQVYVDDHAPAHVHAATASGIVTIFIPEKSAPSVRNIEPGMKASDVRKALDVVADNIAACRKAWSKIHGY